jgi:hypothetical protein
MEDQHLKSFIAAAVSSTLLCACATHHRELTPSTTSANAKRHDCVNHLSKLEMERQAMPKPSLASDPKVEWNKCMEQ